MSLQKVPVLYTDTPHVGGRAYPGCSALIKSDNASGSLFRSLLMFPSEKTRPPLEGRLQQLKITSFQIALALLSMAIPIPHTAERDHRPLCLLLGFPARSGGCHSLETQQSTGTSLGPSEGTPPDKRWSSLSPFRPKVYSSSWSVLVLFITNKGQIKSQQSV
ncbi:hypothetical protein ACSS6W_008126 [Trichoderma asperelloides]